MRNTDRACVDSSTVEAKREVGVVTTASNVENDLRYMYVWTNTQMLLSITIGSWNEHDLKRFDTLLKGLRKPPRRFMLIQPTILKP